VEISDPGLTVHADPQQLTAVLEAVLRNAFDACPPPTARVTINSFSRPSDDTIVVSIADNGRGIAPGFWSRWPTRSSRIDRRDEDAA
jgi:C4-dicarboxylate-specific signal transduction histidine kinase